MAVTPEAAGEQRLGDAIALTNITFQVAQVVGFGLAGVLLHFVGAEAALLLNAATFGLSAQCFGRDEVRDVTCLTQSRDCNALKQAFRQTVSTLLLRRIIVLILLLAFADAAVNALLPVFVRSNDYSPLLLTALAATAPLVGAASGTIVPRDGANRYLLRTSALLTVAWRRWRCGTLPAHRFGLNVERRARRDDGHHCLWRHHCRRHPYHDGVDESRR